MRRLVIAVVFAATARTSAAQHMAPASDSMAVSERQFSALFQGLALDSGATVRARDIIRRTFVQQANMGIVLAHGTWLKLVALQEARDAELVALLSSAEDRAKFDERARRARPRHHFWDWPEPQ